MRKKAKKTKKIKYTGPRLIDSFPKTHGEWLQLCMKLTDRAIGSSNGAKYLVDQRERLDLQFKQWEKQNESQN